MECNAGKKTEISYTYGYDNAGNRIWKKVSAARTAAATEYTYNSRNQLAEEETKGQKTLYHYDANGNLLKKSGAAAEESYTYDVYNRLVSCQSDREGKTSDYLYDGQGNVRGLLDEEGNLTDTYAYNAYGELTAKTGETENHYLYTGEYYDGVSGLYYLRARYMNPETGPDFNPNGNTVQEGVNLNSLSPTKDLSSLDDFRMKNAVKYAGDKPIIVDKNGNVLDGYHRLKHAILNDRAVDVSIGY